jgi:hypothetical protein
MIAIANKVIGLAGQMPLLDAARADELRRLHSLIEALFAPETPHETGTATD